MKCVFCKSECKKKSVKHSELGVEIGKFPALVCTKCGEVFYDTDTADKIQAKSKAKGLFGLVKKTKVAEVGNSLAVRIPRAVATFVGFEKNEKVMVQPTGKHTISITAEE